MESLDDATDNLVFEIMSHANYRTLDILTSVSKRFDDIARSDNVLTIATNRELKPGSTANRLFEAVKLCRPEYVRLLMNEDQTLVPGGEVVLYARTRCIVGYPQAREYEKIIELLGIYWDTAMPNATRFILDKSPFINLHKRKLEGNIPNIINNLDLFTEDRTITFTHMYQSDAQGNLSRIEPVTNHNNVRALTAKALILLFNDIATAECAKFLPKLLASPAFRKYVTRTGLCDAITKRNTDIYKAFANQDYFDLTVDNNKLFKRAKGVNRKILLTNPLVHQAATTKLSRKQPALSSRGGSKTKTSCLFVDRSEKIYTVFRNYVARPSQLSLANLLRAIGQDKLNITWGGVDGRNIFLNSKSIKHIDSLRWTETDKRSKGGLAEYMKDLRVTDMSNITICRYVKNV